MNHTAQHHWNRLQILIVICTIFLCGCKMLTSRGPVPEQVSRCRDYSQQGITHMQQGKWKSAEELFTKAVKSCPLDADAHRQLAEVYWHRGAQQQAISQLLLARKLSPDNVTMDLRLAEMYLALGRTSDALNRVDEAIDIQPDYAKAWALRGKIHESLGHPKQAIGNYLRALDYQHGNRSSMTALANLYLKTNRAERALPITSSLVATADEQKTPDGVWQLHGECLAALGRDEDAIESYTIALQKNPQSSELMVKLAELELSTGRPQDAQRHAQHALAISPRYEPGFEVLRQVQLALNRHPPSTLR